MVDGRRLLCSEQAWLNSLRKVSTGPEDQPVLQRQAIRCKRGMKSLLELRVDIDNQSPGLVIDGHSDHQR